MAAGASKTVVVAALVALVAVGGAGVYSLGEGRQTSSEMSSSQTSTTIIMGGTTISLPYMHGVPVCNDVQFNVTGNSGTLSGALQATGLVKWYILSTTGMMPVAGTLVSGTINQTLQRGTYDLKLCNEPGQIPGVQSYGVNVTITSAFTLR